MNSRTEPNSLPADPQCPTCSGTGTFRRGDDVEVCPCAERLRERAAARVRAVFRDTPDDSLF